MFQGHGGLSMEGDHLDISYNRPDEWPYLTPSGSIRAFIFHVGDAVAGPCFQLGMIRPVEGESLDWRHGIDPLHHHGSDQFRVILSDSWNLAGRRLNAGDYAFQESGIVYQEHPGPGGAGTTMLIMGDRRGNQATIAFRKDVETVFEYDDVYGAPKPGESYPHPAGDRGIAAINTSAGKCQKGYLRGSISALQPGGSGALSGVLGDEIAGPVVHVVNGMPGERIAPPARWSTDIVMLVARGEVTIGGRVYRAGELRVQRERAPIGAILAGDDGAEFVLVVADRRGRAEFEFADGETAPDWTAAAGQLTSMLEPVVRTPR
jgi:hypothetical protein